MEQRILDLCSQGGKLAIEIARELELSLEEVEKVLIENYYYPYKHRSGLRFMNNLRNAILYFLSHEESATKVAKKYGITPIEFCTKLKFFGHRAENKHNRAKFNENIFDVIDTEEKAYWLGFVYADGTISCHYKEKKPRYQFELCTTLQDVGHLRKFNSFMKYEGENIKYSTVALNGNIYNRARWIIGNKHLWETLNKHGCVPNKSLILEFPDIPPHLKRHFIRGYFDGDGSVGVYNGKLQCSCLGTKDMLDNILKDFGWEVKYHHDRRHSDKTYSFQLIHGKAMEFLHYIYNDCTIYLDRKYNTYKVLPSIGGTQ